MLTLKRFIAEASEEDKLKHLEHVEDHVVHGGSEGFAHAFHTLNGVHDKLMGKDNNTKVTIKYDGSPSIVFGTHPDTGKFFVGSKSFFNKNPKINYTPEDIDKNHGHAPGLVKKLKVALEHLPKIHDGKGVYQADIMHTPEDLHHEGHRISHKTQLITYHHKPDSEEGMRAANSKIGVAIHTAYEGNTHNDLKVKQGHVPELEQHPDVHQFPIHHQHEKIPYTQEMQKEYKKHINNAMEAYKKLPKEAFSHAVEHEEALKVHINRQVRTGEPPSAQGYKDHIKAEAAKSAAKVKTDVAKQRHIDAGKKKVASINDDHINGVLDVHRHIQNAKNVLTNAFNSHQIHGHEIEGGETNPEGYVVHHNDRPSKFVLRHEFSAMNLRAGDARKSST